MFWLKYISVFFFQVGERIRVILDCDDNTLAFERNYEFLGVAFRGKFFKILNKPHSNFLCDNLKICCARPMRYVVNKKTRKQKATCTLHTK